MLQTRLIKIFSKQLSASLSIPVFFVLAPSALVSFYPGNLFYLLLVPISYFVATIFSVKIVAELGGAIIRRQRLRLGLKAAALILLIPVIVLGRGSGDYIHLFILYPHYRAVIASSSDEQPVRIDWGDAAIMALDGLKQRTLIYDKGHETEKLVGQTWKDSNGFYNDTRHLIGNFYLELTSS